MAFPVPWWCPLVPWRPIRQALGAVVALLHGFRAVRWPPLAPTCNGCPRYD